MTDRNEIEAALSFISPDLPRSEWIQVGMALRHELDDSGFSLFDDWSSGGEKYDVRDTRDAWRSFKPSGNGSGTVTIGTLFHMAKEGGFRLRKEHDSGSIIPCIRANPELNAVAPAHKQLSQLQRLWDNAKPATSHPYLEAKNLKPTHGLRVKGDLLLVPRYTIDKQLAGIERIYPDGEKRDAKGSTKGNCYHPIGQVCDKTLVIVEGLATGISVQQATGLAVAVAAGVTNLDSVTRILHEAHPDWELVLAPDQDENRHAVELCEAIARRYGCSMVVPKFPDGSFGDFDDLRQQAGLEAVRQQVMESRYRPGTDPWPELIPLDCPKLPSLDLSCLPGWAGEYATALARATETPPELAASMVLAVCATACARRMQIQVKPGYYEPLNLWLIAALTSGNRKSAVQKEAAAPLMDWAEDQARQIEPEIKRLSSERKTLEARAKHLRLKAARSKSEVQAEELARQAARIEADLPEVPVIPRLWTSDATPEQLGNLLASQEECIAWLSSEGGVFDLLGGRYSNGIPNLDLVLKAHSGDPERVDRGSRPPVYLRYPRLTMGLSPQPDVLRGLASKPGFRGRGLLARFLYLLPVSQLGYRTLNTEPIPNQVRQGYASAVRAMLDWGLRADYNPPCHLLQLSPSASEEWQQFAAAVESQMRPGGDLEQATDWAGKAPGAAARLAGVLHAIQFAYDRPWEHSISKDTMSAALEIMTVLISHSIAALETMGADPVIEQARLVWRWVERNRLSLFTVREAFTGIRGPFKRVQQIEAAIIVLQERGYLEIQPPPQRKGPGRPPSPTVLVRPEFTEKWR